MPHCAPVKTKSLVYLKNLIFIVVILSSCTIPRKYQKNKPFVFKNTIEVKGGNFTPTERSSLKQKLSGQLNDSSKVVTKDIVFVLHYINRPPAYDSGYSAISVRNMKATLMHLGYYGATANYTADTSSSGQQQRVTVKYIVEAGNPTLIDTISYNLKKPELQQLALQTRAQSYLKISKPVTKSDILNEIGRLVELYRNNGYYKFTSDDLKMRGDTTIEALTNISDDPFENLRLLAEANEKRNRPTVKLAVVLNPLADSARLKKYYINNVYIYPDFSTADPTKNSPYTEKVSKDGYIVLYNRNIARLSFLGRNMFFKKGDVYSQETYAKTINSFSKTGVWQNVNIQVVERKDSIGKVDMIVQMAPAKDKGFEANIEASYSANSNANTASAAGYAGNLLGLSTNLSLQNRNVHREGIKITHALRVGVEFNLSSQKSLGNLINSNELSYSPTISFPRLILFPRFPPLFFLKKRTDSIPKYKKYLSQQTFVNASVEYTNRIALFNLQTVGLGAGWGWVGNKKTNHNFLLKPLNFEFSFLYNQSDSFKRTLADNPYLRYSFNTALVFGPTFSYTSTIISPRNINRIGIFKWNIEESGFPNIFKNYMRHFIKTDFEFTSTTSRPHSAWAFRGFAGFGLPLDNNDTATLPFFKQYYSGGANSMRAWPVRGIGPGAKPLADFGSSVLNDRTGDIRLEGNIEYRKDLFQIIPNTLMLKGALFIDIGNVWNFKNTRPGGGPDSLQFSFKTLYKQLGVAAGTGLRFDFTYFLLRIDLGFRFKRPDLTENDGWKAPSIGFDDLFKKLFSRGANDEFRKWRYENFNFTIGLSYPF